MRLTAQQCDHRCVPVRWGPSQRHRIWLVKSDIWVFKLVSTWTLKWGYWSSFGSRAATLRWMLQCNQCTIIFLFCHWDHHISSPARHTLLRAQKINVPAADKCTWWRFLPSKYLSQRAGRAAVYTQCLLCVCSENCFDLYGSWWQITGKTTVLHF